MTHDLPSNSGFLVSPSDKISAQFSDYAELPCKGHNLIYKAKRYGKWHILKGLKPEFRYQPFYQDLLRKEFELGVMLTHPNIVTVMSFEDDETVGRCIVMEYIDGATLSEFIESKPPRKQMDKVLDEVLSAMSYYHSKQVVHRDLKPNNILVTRNGNNVKIIDFGLSDADSYVALKQPAGTLRYAAPEQLQEGAPIDCRTDLFALGKILEYDFPNRYNWLAYRCIRQLPEQRPDNAEMVRGIIRRHRIVGRSSIVFCIVALLIVLFFALPFPRRTSNVAEKEATAVPRQTQAETRHDTVVTTRTDTIVKSSGADFKPGSKEERLLKQLERDMHDYFDPSIQELKRGKYQWRDDISMLTNNIASNIHVIEPIISQVPITSNAYSVLNNYYAQLYKQYFEIINRYAKKLPSWMESYIALMDQYNSREIDREELQKRVEELGPDPSKQWSYDANAKLWRRNGN